MDYLSNLLESLTGQFGSALPKVLGALAVLILGFFIAGIIKKLVEKLLKKTSLDEKLASKFDSPVRIDKFIAKLFYYLVVLFTLLTVLSMLGVESVLTPLENMLGKFVGFLPNVIGAGIIGFAGYVISSIASEATGFLSERLESFGGKIGMDTGSISLSKIVKQVVFVLVFIPILIVALDTLKMTAISEPATEMLGSMLDAIPKIIAAVVLLGIFYIVGKYVTTIISDLLGNLGLDELSGTMGLQSVIGKSSISKMIGKILLFFIMFSGVIAASDKLDLGQFGDILNDIFGITGKVFFGLLIMMLGVFISNIATKALSEGEGNKFLVPIAKFAILGIFLAFALHTMGIAESIVNMAFGLTLGAIAVAFALSFGLGGRDAAGKQMEDFFKSMKK